MRYELRLMDTVSGVACFSAFPGPNLSFSEMLGHLKARPYDDFMHQRLLHLLGEHRTKKVEKLINELTADQGLEEPVLAALLYEACLSHDRLFHLRERLEGLDKERLCRFSPLVHIRSDLLADKDLNRKWTALLGSNILDHRPLPAPDAAGMPLLYDPEDLDLGREALSARAALAELREKGLPEPLPRPSAEETSARALKVLEDETVFLGREMAHKANLSPVSLLRHWVVDVRVKNGRHSDTLGGIQTAYGRGFSQEEARASYAMEMVERASAFAGFGESGVLNYARPYPLTFGSFEAVSAEARALDPGLLRLEVPYQGQGLNWIEGQVFDGREHRPLLVPAQLVFMFCNLDEPSLFSAFGSTGLASGNTLDEARLSGLCEALERDAVAVTPFTPKRCFRLAAEDPAVSARLKEYEDNGIHLWFMDLTQEFGVPCYKSVVLGARGDVNAGAAADLNGQRAAVSAMTETPYPFPGPATLPAPEGLPIRLLEDLPDLSTGSARGDLMVLEATLAANGYFPVYLDLTRRDLGIPVARALVPGLEMVADFDQFSRVGPRLFGNYLKMF